jgi:hypothetical protein
MLVKAKSPTCKGTRFSWSKMSGADTLLYLVQSISGLDFVAKDFNRTRTPSVASMSLGGGLSTALDSAVTRVSLVVIHFRISLVLIPGFSFSSLPLASPSLSLQETIMRTLSTPPLPVLNKQSLSQPRPLMTPRLPSQTLVPVSTSGLLVST